MSCTSSSGATKIVNMLVCIPLKHTHKHIRVAVVQEVKQSLSIMGSGV